MPLTKNKYDYIKVYRPTGIKYGQGRHSNIVQAMIEARTSFIKEFGYEPISENVVVEIVGVTGLWIANFFEVKE